MNMTAVSINGMLFTQLIIYLALDPLFSNNEVFNLSEALLNGFCFQSVLVVEENLQST